MISSVRRIFTANEGSTNAVVYVPQMEKILTGHIDDYSHVVILKILNFKNEVEENLINYVREVEWQHGIKVKRFRLDNGDEFAWKAFNIFVNK